ncbi:esterase/lipase family protein, partial [Intrasporangium sp.]|uniref:esterase/lipase family protein n=1 Tax=Intrasporangium sp. TaxID=1925024 RepID=UPI00397764B1
MPPTSFESEGVRVVVPGSYDVRESSRARALPGEPGFEQTVARDAILASLEDSGLEPVQRLDLTPQRTRDLAGERRAGPKEGTATVEVDVAADEDAVVLLERDGVYSWRMPTDAGRRTRSIDVGPRTARFEIDLRAEGSGSARARRARGAGRTKGLLGDVVTGAVQAVVFRFAAPLVVGKVMERMEEHVRPGLVHITDTDLGSWRRFDRLDELDLPTDRPVRLLLLVHGTFSSTAGGFAAFSHDENAKGLLRTAIAAYDAVIGFDHRTLSVDPRANARDLLERLSSHQPGDELIIDVITHSRGGLTTRSLVEYELPGSTWPGRVDRVVFVGATNGGTHLADPGRWHDLVDLYTNLVSVGAGALVALPGGAPVAAVVAGVIKGVGALVKYLVSYASGEDGVPGLAAMVPDGPFVTDLNTAQPGQPAPGTNWFVVASHFHVELFDDSHQPPEFPRELVVKLAEGFVDELFQGDNDLVVDTDSMSAIGLPVGGFVADARVFETNDRIYHTNYFSQLDVIEAIAGWLPLGMGAGGGPEAAPEQPDVVGAEPPESGGDEAGAAGGSSKGGRGVTGREAGPEPPGDRGLPMAPPPPAPAPSAPAPSAP